MTSTQADGHWPFAYDALTIGCECGWKPARPPARSSMRHVPHMAHRRKLGLTRVEYLWPDGLSGLSEGGYAR